MRMLAFPLALLAAAPAAAEIGSGTRTYTQTFDGRAFNIETYRPNCANPDIMFVHHGASRVTYSGGYDDVADRECFVVVAPIYPTANFNSDTYQSGGIVDASGNVLPAGDWTTRYEAMMIDWALSEVTGADEVYLFGHSAGGQFLSRIAAYERLTTNVDRYIIANPSTWVRASGVTGFDNPNDAAPYGYDNFPPAGAAELAEYLALPIVVYLGANDTDPNDPDLATGSYAMAQGPHRRARGEFVFNEAQGYAQAHNLPFNWTLLIAPGVGHSGSDMLRSPALIGQFVPSGGGGGCTP